MPFEQTNDNRLSTASDSALHELFGNIKNQTDVLEKMRQDKAEENKEKNNTFDSLHQEVGSQCFVNEWRKRSFWAGRDL